jgi:hypothetical protein
VSFTKSKGLGSLSPDEDRRSLYPRHRFFTLPSTFSESIQYTERATNFYDTVVKAELKEFFDDTAACTVFAPVDRKKDHMCKIDPKEHIICNFIGFSPELYSGVTYYSAAGTPINVTIADDGTKRLNGIRVLTSDISTKNGVLHLIEKVCRSVSSIVESANRRRSPSAARKVIAVIRNRRFLGFADRIADYDMSDLTVTVSS